MADTITISAVSPSNPIIATDEVTIASVLQHVQRVKLVDGTDGGTDLIAGSAANGLGVDVTRVQGTVIIQGQQSAIQSGSITTATSVVGPFTCSNYNLATVAIYGTYAGVTAVFEGSPDGTNWFTLQGVRTDSNAYAETGPTALGSTNRAWDVPIPAFTQFRIRATAWTSGTANIAIIFQTMPFEPAPAAGLMILANTNAMQPVGFGTGANNMPVILNNIANSSANSPAQRSFQALAVIQSPNFQPTHMASTAGIVSVPTTASTTTSVAYLWHPSSVTARYEIVRIEVEVEGPTTASTAGQQTTLRIARITAENGSPGGAAGSIMPLDQSDAASGGTFRIGATGAPTRQAIDFWTKQVQTVATNVHHAFVWSAEQANQGKGIVCRASTAEGWEVRAVTNGTAIGSAITVSVTYYWKEVQ